jgi:hypothetical protein
MAGRNVILANVAGGPRGAQGSPWRGLASKRSPVQGWPWKPTPTFLSGHGEIHFRRGPPATSRSARLTSPSADSLKPNISMHAQFDNIVLACCFHASAGSGSLGLGASASARIDCLSESKHCRHRSWSRRTPLRNRPSEPKRPYTARRLLHAAQMGFMAHHAASKMTANDPGVSTAMS